MLVTIRLGHVTAHRKRESSVTPLCEPQILQIQVHYSIHNSPLLNPNIGRAMAQAVSRRPLIAVARFRSRASRFVVGKVALGQV